jgi:hypothetical protein
MTVDWRLQRYRHVDRAIKQKLNSRTFHFPFSTNRGIHPSHHTHTHTHTHPYAVGPSGNIDGHLLTENCAFYDTVST